MNLNISSLPYHHEELHTLLSSLRIKPKILTILESRIKNDGLFSVLACRIKLHITTEASTGGAPLYIEKYLTYKTWEDLLMLKSKN